MISEAVRKKFESFYDSKLTIFQNQLVGDIIKKPQWVQVNDEPIKCRISTRDSHIQPAWNTDESIPQQSFTVVLFVSPFVDIPPGSRLRVTNWLGEELDYELSGEGLGSYYTHKAFPIKRWVAL